MSKPRKPRVLTLTLPRQNQPELVLEGRTYTLRNFNQDGVGVWLPYPLAHGLKPKSRFKGEMTLGKDRFPVTLEVVHLSERYAGLRLLDLPTSLKNLFTEILRPAEYASSLKPAEIREVSGTTLLRFSATPEVELLVWFQTANRRILELQLAWIGNFVARAAQCAAIAGYVTDGTVLSGQKFESSQFTFAAAQKFQTLLSQASQLLSATEPPIPGHLLWQFLETGEQVYLTEECLRAIHRRIPSSKRTA